MTLAGGGIVAIWNDVIPEGLANFYAWHNGEHMPERVAIPGFLRGRRYRAVDGSPSFFTLYEVADAAVLTGSDYMQRLNAPTDWTRRSVRDFRNTKRALCVVEATAGFASGGLLTASVLDRRPEDWAAPTDPAIVAAHVCRADLEAGEIDTVEKRGRHDADAPPWIELLESTGADCPANSGTFRLEIDLLAG